MARSESGRPLDDLLDLDLDAGLSPEEREIVAATPFYGLAKTLAGLFFGFVLIFVASHMIRDAAATRQRVAEVRTMIEAGTQATPTATPAEVLRLGGSWIEAQRGVRRLRMSDRERVALAQGAVGLARAILDRGAAHLSAIEYLDAMEAADLIQMLDVVMDTVGVGIDRTAYQPTLARAADVVTETAVRLARNGAPAPDLRRAAALLFRVAPVADPRLQAEYAETASALVERANAAERRGAATEAMGVGDENLRVEFAGALFAMLQGGDNTLSEIAAEGDDSRILRVQGRGPRARLAEMILRNGEVRERLLALAFVTVRAVGDDGVLEVDIETLEGRVPPAGR